MKGRTCLTMLAALIASWAIVSAASAQITTGAVTGTVTDSQGGVIPGATVVLISETQGTKTAPVVTNGTGQYTVPNVTGDTYTVEITMSGFKTLTRKGVKVIGGDRVSVETQVLQVGGTTENVTVQAEAPVIQAATGERSSAVQTVQLDNLPIANHNFLDFVGTQIGVNGALQNQNGQRIGGGGQDNVMIDGISSLDTGNNGLMINLPQQMVSEVKVLTSSYQAEYGRSSGLQISAVTRGGTNRFRGSFYDYERNSDWNANSWANAKNGNAKNVNKERDWGYTIGGPVGKPGGHNKLFFFYAHEYRPRTTGGSISNYRLPTELERRGDFSQTLDNNGNLYNYIYDPSTLLPKSACSGTATGDHSACFQDGGVLGRIPLNKLYGPGMALLNQYPLPNNPQVTGRAYNYSVTLPIQKQLGYTPTIRFDYQASEKLRATFKASMPSARIVPGFAVNGQPNNPLPGLTDTIQQFPLSFNISGTVNYTLNNTTFIETTYGINQNRLGEPLTTKFSNRNNVVCPSDLASSIANCTLGALPQLFPDAGVVDKNYYEFGALQQIGTPFFQDGRILLPPQLNWGTTRIGNVPPTLNYPGWLNINRIQQAAGSVTKIMGRHTAKAGIYFEHSYKAQNDQTILFQGSLNVGVDTNNPLDSQMAFSNVALGVFSQYAQKSKFIEGNFYYNNIDWYIQDNWKYSRKLTLDYGLRFAHDGTYVDNLQQVSNFFPDKYKFANAPVLYEAGCLQGFTTTGCVGGAANRVARDPRTNTLLPAGTGSLIGQAILGTGDFANGMVRAGTNGISNAGYTWPKMVVAPRVGVAYDVTGKQKLVLRGAAGLYFDRPDGNSVFSTVGNPPVATSLTQQWGRLSELSNPNGSSLGFGPVPNVNANDYNQTIPKDVQWNFGAQYALPWASSIDVSYVGHHAFDVLANTQNGGAVNYNQIDVGTTLLPQNQDPTQPAGTPLNTNLLRAFRGYNNISIQRTAYHRTFHSMQFSWTRRFSHGFSFQVNDTWTLSDKGNTGLPGPQLRLIHNSDGSFTVSPDQAIAEKLFANQGTTTHIAIFNGVWDLPDLKRENTVMKAVGHVINDWQLSGIFRADSGTSYDVGYTYNSGPTGQSLTGSPDYTSRIVINDLSALGSGCSSDQYQQITNTMVPATAGLISPVMTPALAGPQVGSHGLESGRNLLHGCKDHRLDLAIQRSIRLGGGRSLEFRADLYNAFKAVVINARQTTIQFNNTGDFSVRNSQYLFDGTSDPARVRPNQAGFGAATGARGATNNNYLRSVQGRVTFRF